MLRAQLSELGPVVAVRSDHDEILQTAPATAPKEPQQLLFQLERDGLVAVILITVMQLD